MTDPERSTLDIAVVPNAKRSAVEMGEAYLVRVRVTAPAIDGKANEAVCKVLAQALRVRPRDITIVRGATARRKTVAVDGLGPAELQARLKVLDTS